MGYFFTWDPPPRSQPASVPLSVAAWCNKELAQPIKSDGPVLRARPEDCSVGDFIPFEALPGPQHYSHYCFMPPWKASPKWDDFSSGYSQAESPAMPPWHFVKESLQVAEDGRSMWVWKRIA